MMPEVAEANWFFLALCFLFLFGLFVGAYVSRGGKD